MQGRKEEYKKINAAQKGRIKKIKQGREEEYKNIYEGLKGRI